MEANYGRRGRRALYRLHFSFISGRQIMVPIYKWETEAQRSYDLL